MNYNEIKEILKKHAMWLVGDEEGARAYFRSADLSGADLSGANLRRAYLSGANLTDAYLSGANLTDAYLSGADLTGAYLSGADLSGANLRSAYLTGAYLSGADLSGANLSGANLTDAYLTDAYLTDANLSGANLKDAVGLPPLSCPEEGSYIGFKKAEGHIVVLQIAENAKRSSAASRKCRASEAKVLRIENLDGAISDRTWVTSDYDYKFVYTIGKTVRVENFDDDRWNECAPGIHHFITRQEAVYY